MSHFKAMRAWSAVALAACMLAGTAQAQSLYAVKDLSLLTPDQQYITWTSLTNMREMFGFNDALGATVYSKGVLRQLGIVPTGATRMNNRGDVIFNERTEDYNTGRALFVTRDGTWTELPRLYPNAQRETVFPTAVNDVGAIVGTSVVSKCNVGAPSCIGQTFTRAFTFADGTIADLGTLGGESASASWINKEGVIVGYSYRAGGTDERPFRYANGHMEELVIPELTHNRPTRINNAGQIIGVGWDRNYYDTAWFYDKGMVTVLTDPAATHVHATAMNNYGSVVGAGSNGRAFLYQNGQMMYLDDLVKESGWSIQTPSDINDQGMILAEAVRPDGKFVFVMLSPLEKRKIAPSAQDKAE